MHWGGGIRRGLNVPAMVELVDLAPTVLDAAGLPRYEGMQGRSLWPILSGAADASHHRDSVYHEYYRAIPGGHKNHGGAHITGVRNRQFALSAVHGADCGELYDLAADPGEVHNLWNSQAHVGVKADMLKLLADRMWETIDPLPPTEAFY
jgi:arylsulfatase A-like enzyme